MEPVVLPALVALVAYQVEQAVLLALVALAACPEEQVAPQALVALVALVAYPVVLLVCLYLRLSFSLLHAANSNLAIDV